MGLMFGKICVETPKFQILKSTTDYEIRKYPACVVAQITYDPSQTGGGRDGGFTVLASYIGAFGRPQNTKPEKIAMTAPVITSTEPEKIAMTAPVVTKSTSKMITMQFLLPSKYTKAEEAPKPTDDRVVIREEGERTCGVESFSGAAKDGVVEEKAGRLKESLEKDGYKVTGDVVLARYNPPWSLPLLRTNEIMFPVELVENI